MTITKDTVDNVSSSVGKREEGSIGCDPFPEKANVLVEKFDPRTKLRPFITTCSLNSTTRSLGIPDRATGPRMTRRSSSKKRDLQDGQNW